VRQSERATRDERERERESAGEGSEKEGSEREGSKREREIDLKLQSTTNHLHRINTSYALLSLEAETWTLCTINTSHSFIFLLLAVISVK
jgi:hypothetical protein